MQHTYKTKNVCPRQISFDLKEGIIRNIQFDGGCNGNLKAIPVLLEGMKADEVIHKLQGITCNGRPTSCADQLAAAVAEAMKDTARLQEESN